MPRSTPSAPSRSAAAERLEDRIAPAVFVNAKTLTYFDIDGDTGQIRAIYVVGNPDKLTHITVPRDIGAHRENRR